MDYIQKSSQFVITFRLFHFNFEFFKLLPLAITVYTLQHCEDDGAHTTMFTMFMNAQTNNIHNVVNPMARGALGNLALSSSNSDRSVGRCHVVFLAHQNHGARRENLACKYTVTGVKSSNTL